MSKTLRAAVMAALFLWAALGGSGEARAQGAVLQSGTAVPGHVATWFGNGVIGDSPVVNVPGPLSVVDGALNVGAGSQNILTLQSGSTAGTPATLTVTGAGGLVLPAFTAPSLTLSGAGTGLTVTNNVSVGGSVGVGANLTVSGGASVGGLANLGTAQTASLSVGDLDGALGYGAARFGAASGNFLLITPGSTAGTAATLTLGGTAGLALPVVMLPSWTTTGRPAATTGTVGINTTTGFPEVALGGAFHQVITDQGGQTIPSLTLSGIGTALTVTNGASAGSLTVTGTSTSTPLFGMMNNATPSAAGVVAGYDINSVDTTTFPASGTNTRPRIFADTLTVTGTTSGIHENLWSTVTLNGTGTLSNEVNLVHSYFENDGSVTVSGSAETFEASALNNATISGIFDDYLALFHNGASGTTNFVYGVKGQLVNDNTTAASVANYALIDLEAMSGAGSAPTSAYVIRNNWSLASINTIGGIAIGTLTPQPAGTLFVSGPDTSGGTALFDLKNSAATDLFQVRDDGTVVMLSDFTTSGAVNALAYKVSGTLGVTCSGSPTASFAATNGIVTHC